MKKNLSKEQISSIMKIAEDLGIPMYPVNPKRRVKFIHNKAEEGPFPKEIVALTGVIVHVKDDFSTQEIILDFPEVEGYEMTDEEFNQSLLTIGKIVGAMVLIL